MVYFLGYWIFQAIELFRYPIPTEYRDWGLIDLSISLHSNKSPYSFADGPPFIFVYGALSSLVVGWFSTFAGLDGLAATKIMVCSCVIAAALIIAYEILSITRSGFYAALGFCCVLWANFNSGMFFILRPDALGLVICLLSLVIIRRDTKPINLAVCAILLVLTFYTKQYFIFVIAPIGLYLLIRRGFLVSLIFSAYLLSFFGLSLLLVLSLWPAYFYQSILAQFNSVGGPWSYSGYQALQFGLIYWPLLILATYYFYQIYSKRIEFSRAENLYCLVLLISFACLLPMGRNAGAFLSYHYQLALPALTIVGMLALSKLDLKLIRVASAWVIVFLCIYHGEYPKFSSIYSDQSLDRWITAKSILDEEGGEILVSTPILNHLPGKFTRLDNGHSECYTALVARPYPLLNWIFPKRAIYYSEFAKYYDRIAQKINKKEYGLIVVTSGYHPMISQSILETHYRKSREIDLQTGAQVWKTEFWKRID
jgi:hypothetical protein